MLSVGGASYERKVSVMDDLIKMVNFEEDGNYYIFMIDNPQITIDEAIEVINSMDQYK